MPTLTDLTKALETTPATVRRWTKDYSEFLSPGANPPKGEIRSYTNEDGQVIALIATMRKSNKPYEAIRAALASGIREQWPPPSPQTNQDDPEQPPNALALINQLTIKASSLEGKLSEISQERDRLILERDTAQDDRLAAEIRAAAAEAQIESKHVGWWDRFLGRG